MSQPDYPRHTAALAALYNRCEPSAEDMRRCLPDLEGIERELQAIVNEAMHLPQLEAGERISACAEAALEILGRIIHEGP